MPCLTSFMDLPTLKKLIMKAYKSPAIAGATIT